MNGNESASKWSFSLVANNLDSNSNSNTDNDGVTPVTAAVTQKSKGSVFFELQSSIRGTDTTERGTDTGKDVGDGDCYNSTLDSPHHLGWKFSGPSWSLSSTIVLELTYRPAWQALPEYTNLSAPRDWCCRGKGRGKPVQFFTDVYTTDNIQKVQHLPDLHIRGIGPCRAVRLFLRTSTRTEDCLEQVPGHLQTKLNEQQQQQQQQKNDNDNDNEFARYTEPADSLPLPPWEANTRKGDGTAQQNEKDAKHEFGPIVIFAMPIEVGDGEQSTPLLWKVQLPPNPNIAMETWTVLDASLNSAPPDATDNFHSPTHLYINGYQSWSFAGSVARGMPQPKSALPDMFSKAFNHGGLPPPKNSAVCIVDTGSDRHDDKQSVYEQGTSRRESPRSTNERKTATKQHDGYCSEFFTCITSDGRKVNSDQTGASSSRLLDESGGPALVVGWLSQHRQFGVITVDAELQRIAMHASSQGQIMTKSKETDWGYAQLVHNYDEEPMVHFLHAVAAYNQARPLQNGPLLTGWCSWYHYYENISSANLKENFEKLYQLRNKIPANVSIIDDGYMTAWGDWDSLKPKQFPSSGLAVVAEDIRTNGMRPGLWLAPFTCDKKSNLAKEHPDWIIQNDHGRRANSSNCGKFFYGLDATNPAVRKYVFGCIRRAVQEWGFDVLKIDFLYAACLAGNGKHDLSMSRAEAMHLALDTIRDAAGPDTFLIGCGCPVGTGVGYVDGMRVSADTGPTWYPAFPFPWWDHGTLPCLKSMIRNSISRAPMGHRWWHNDPDCLLLGKSTSLTDDEVSSAASIVAMTCGMMLLSDDLTLVPAGRMRTLSKIFPMTGATAVVLDLHSSNDGMPSLLRLWCTDRFELAPYVDNNNNSDAPKQIIGGGATSFKDHNAEATFFGRHASFNPDKLHVSIERKRNCIHVAKGLGTWTVVSLSNWQDEPAIVYAPVSALRHPRKLESDCDLAPTTIASGIMNSDSQQEHLGQYGYHQFSFWSSTYVWMPPHQQERDDDVEDMSASQSYSSGNDTPSYETLTLSKRLLAHETEIFHIKPVSSLKLPQYIGSDLHFSCGYEVKSFSATSTEATLCLKNNWSRTGSVFVFVPRTNVDTGGVVVVKVSGVPVQRKYGGWEVVANTPGRQGNDNNRTVCVGRIVRIWVVVHGDESMHDGVVSIQF